ncbi:hypothetical protein GGI01_000650 [Coemansia sp. RSA 376]|nr:hypothetical protein GGI01_000650 [Coemansia sp. RSA 376]
MKTGALTSIWLLATAVALAETGGDSGAVAGGRHVKIGRIPRGLEHYAKRDGEESSGGGSGSAKTTPTPTSTKSNNNNNSSSSGGNTSTKPTSQSTSPKPTNSGSSKGSSSGTEQGPLDSDKEHSTSATHTSGSNNGGSSKGEQSGDTDPEGNPILTNEHASYWNMITPTGVSYLSGGWRVVPGAAMVAAAVAVGAFI